MTTQSKREAHPADGLYYTTIARLREVVPSYYFGDLRRDLCRYGEEDPIPVTQALIHKLRQTRCSTVFSVPIKVMLRNGQITPQEQDSFRSEYAGAVSGSQAEAGAFMNLLLSRAKREGRA